MKRICNEITAKYAVVQAAYWMGSCIISSYAGVYLLGEGFTNTEIGLLIGLVGAVSTVMQPWVGGIVDRSERITLRSVSWWFGILMALLSAVLILFGNKIVVVIVYSVLRTLLQVALPLVSAMGMESINRGNKLNFGLARGMGSIAYAVLTSITGFATAVFSSHVLTYEMLITCILFVVGIQLFPREKDLSHEPEAMQEVAAPGKAFFGRYPKFFFLLVGWTLVFTSYGLINNFLFQIMESKGGDSSSMGIALAISALSEVPTMFLFVELVGRLKSGVWMKLSSVFFMLKVLGILVFSSIVGIYVVHALQMLGYALFAVASVYYVNCLMEDRDKVTGQAYMTMTTTMGAVIGSTVGGVIIAVWGIEMMLIFATVIAVVVMVIVFPTTEKNI